MNAKELRAAAERYRVGKYTDNEYQDGIYESSQKLDDRTLLADAYIEHLATVRDDDDEPVTQEWCELHPTEWREHLSQYIHRRNPALIITNGYLCVGGKRTPITTLGPLRRLLSDLGIEVPNAD